jgi:hypothetical protein
MRGRLRRVTPQLYVLLGIAALVVLSLVATRPRTRKPLALLVLVLLLAYAFGAF